MKFSVMDWSAKSKHLLVACAVVILLSSSVVALDYRGVQGEDANIGDLEQQAQLSFSEREPIAPPADGITVVGTHPGDQLVAFAPDGRLLYYNETMDRYHDVDPVLNTTATVDVIGAEYLKPEQCGGNEQCTRNFIQRINLSTGDTRTIYDYITTYRSQSVTHRWHDADRLGPHRYVVADIRHESIFIVNTTTGERTYTWFAQSEFPLSGGGPHPKDWTHVNDVEALPDGRIMVSLRNQDAVVFLKPGEGMQESWTFGADDNHEILFEQHNPDYIPRSRGGPAVVVADSENDRVVESQRANGSWEQTWVWQDKKMSWPRDADRLPNGHTLIADSHGNRILEVNQQGEIVWKVTGLTNYDVERLGTGDESAGGHSAKQLGLESRTAGKGGGESTTDSVIPPKVRHAAQFVMPTWMSFYSLIALAAIGVAGAVAVGTLGRMSRISLRSPVTRE